MIFVFREYASTFLITAVLVFWMISIMKRFRAGGKPAPFQSSGWFCGHFRQGAKVIRRSAWLLVTPLAAQVICSIDYGIRSYFYAQENPDALDHIRSLKPPGFFSGFSFFLRNLPRVIPSSLLEAAGRIDTAMFSPLHSVAVMIIFMTAVAITLFISGPPRANDMRDDFSGKKYSGFGVLAGLVVLSYICILDCVISPEDLNLSSLDLFLFVSANFAYTIAWVFAIAIFLPAIHIGTHEEHMSPRKAVLQVGRHFGPLFLSVLIIGGAGLVADAPLYAKVIIVGPEVHDIGLLRKIASMEKQVFFVMVSFVPVIIVARNRAIVPAFRDCTTLWSSQIKNATAFVLISASLLLIPKMLGRLLHWCVPPLSLGGHLTSFFISMLRVTAGTIVMASMMAFCGSIPDRTGKEKLDECS